MYLYRAGFNPKGDIMAKNPDDEKYDWSQAVRCGDAQTRFISTTELLLIASERYANGEPVKGELKCTPRAPVIMIDTDRLDPECVIVPEEQEIKRNDPDRTNKWAAKKLARANRQVLIEKRIPEDAYVIIPPMLVDVLAYMQTKLDYLSREISHLEVLYEKDIDVNISNYKKLRDECIKKIKLWTREEEALTDREKEYKSKRGMINDQKEKKEEYERLIKAFRSEKRNLPNKISELKAQRENLANALSSLQKDIMEGYGEMIIEDYILDFGFTELEKQFIEVYYGSDASMGEIARMFDKASSVKKSKVDYDDVFDKAKASDKFKGMVEREGRVSGLDVATAVRQGIIKKIFKSKKFRDYVGLDESFELDRDYRIIPYGRLLLSSEQDDRDRSSRYSIPLGKLYDDVIYLRNGTKMVKDCSIEDETDEVSTVVMELQLKARDSVRVHDSIQSIPVHGIVEVDRKRFEDLIQKRKEEEKRRKLKEKTTRTTKKKTKSSDVVQAGEKLEEDVKDKNSDNRDDYDS